jgi:hypothetical protein
MAPPSLNLNCGNRVLFSRRSAGRQSREAEAIKCARKAREHWEGQVCDELETLGKRVQALLELGLSLEDNLLGERTHVQQQLAVLVCTPSALVSGVPLLPHRARGSVAKEAHAAGSSDGAGQESRMVAWLRVDTCEGSTRGVPVIGSCWAHVSTRNLLR